AGLGSHPDPRRARAGGHRYVSPSSFIACRPPTFRWAECISMKERSFGGAMKRIVRTLVVIVGLVAALELAAFGRSSAPDSQTFSNATGEVRTFSTQGGIDVRNAFFQSLGTNGRSCGSCHQASDAWSITPAHLQARFDLDGGLDPIFRTNAGFNSPLADVSTVEARKEAYSMLLSKGLIRVGIGIPANAEFELIEVDDPYGYASASELSLFRRPLPSTNLSFLSAVMWDGRETFAGQSIHFDLSDQANGATLGHAAAANPLTAEQREEIVNFNTFPIQISGVRCLNDVLDHDVITGTCTSCHDAPNIGNHSVSLPLDIGIASESRRTPDMPLYTFRNKTTGEVVKTTDPGRALITGTWKHT